MGASFIISILGPLLMQLVPQIAQALVAFIESFYAAKNPGKLAELVQQTVESMAALAVSGAEKRQQALADIMGALAADATYAEGIAVDELNMVVNGLIEKFALQYFKKTKAAA